MLKKYLIVEKKDDEDYEVVQSTRHKDRAKRLKENYERVYKKKYTIIEVKE